MFRNYLKVTFRNLLRHKLYAFINIFGLAVGFAACLLIFLFVDYEQNFDAFHSKKDQVYRLNEVQTWEGIIPQKVALSMYPMGPTLQADFPEVEAYTHVITRNQVPLMHKDKKIYIDQIYLVDSSFFDLFDFELVYGDPGVVLQERFSIVITEETALRYFDHTDVLGERMELIGEDTLSFTITGILKNIPENSHLQFDGLVALNSLPEMHKRSMERWGNNWLVTYLQLTPGTDIAAIEAKFPDYLTKYMGERATDGYQLFVQPLSDIHLGSSEITHDYQNVGKFNGKYIYTFGFLAVFVLLIAGINFMNLTTARSALRLKEVGVRKTIGATQQHLVRQFIIESVFFAVFALMLALLITDFSLPALRELSGRPLAFSALLRPERILSIGAIAVLVGLFAGIYPALFMAGFKPVQALKGRIFLRSRNFSLQNVLVVMQFAIATAMIVGTLIATRQLRHMTFRDPGFNKEQVMLLSANREVVQGFEAFQNALMRQPAIRQVTASGQRLGSNIHQTGIQFKADTAVQNLAISHVNVDYTYLDLYEIELLKGRDFSKAHAQDAGHAFIINETLAEKLGVEDPVGMPLKFHFQEEWGTVIGLAKNFNYNSFHHDINPLAMSIQPNFGYSEISIRIDPRDLPAVLPVIEDAWRASGTDRPFDYSFLDTHFDELYRTDLQVSKVVGIIAGLAILIACMGLFGLVSISTEQRTKEIGIRKVLGATVGDVIFLFARGVAVLVMIAFALAVPFTWWFMNDWLASFAYRIELGAGVFLAAGGIALLVALLTISYLTYRAASGNPIEALRYE